MIFAAFYFYKKDRVISFIILFFISTISIVSNIVFPIGTNMSERFLFMPSLAFSLFIPYAIYKFIPNGKTVLSICSVILVLFSIKTISRNQVWKNDFTLFTTDVKTSPNSAKILNAAGGALSTEASKEKDETKKKKMLEESLVYLNKAVKIHPTYKNPYLLMGNAHFYLGNYEKSIEAYQNCLKLDPNFKDAINNLAVAYRDAGRKAGEKENNLPKAESLLQKSLQVNANDVETLRLMGITYGIAGQHEKAITYFEKIIKIEPKNAAAYQNLSSAYNYAGDVTNAAKYRQIALQLDPEIDKKK
jgi:tetratricopeptide (TPR) repeat protein